MATKASVLRSAVRDESGGVTILALFSLILTVICLGFAIDATNLYRHQAMLRITADAAAHAGAVALARGETPETAEAAARAMLALNMPYEAEDGLVANPATDLRALVVNPADGTLSKQDPDTPANAMLVSLQRSKTVRNAIPTLILGLFGVDSWSATTTSVATVASTRRCANASGLFAQGPITIDAAGTGAQPSDGMCVHSQQALDLPAGPGGRDGGPRVSLPMRTACTGGGCGTAAEVNLIMPDIAAYVARLAWGFADHNLGLPEKRSFFAERPLARDLEPLAEIGVEIRGLETGDVITLSAFRFRLMREVPQGLVYLVMCGQPGAEVETGGKDEIFVGEWQDSPALRNITLVTSCPIRLAEHALVEGSLIISTAADAGLATANAAARFGDPDGACDPSRRSIVMTAGDIALPVSLTTSNIAVVAGGDVALGLPGETAFARGRGLSVHAGGAILGTGAQEFKPCPGAEDDVLPALRVIGFSMPLVEGWVTPVKPAEEVDLPGRKPDRLAAEEGRS
jgi:Putative Flp pilus-assembly TadE/G-like